MKENTLSEYEENTFKILERSIAVMKGAGRGGVVKKWENILNNCREKIPSDQKIE